METILFSIAVMFCMTGLLMSSLAFSGTWLVLAAGVIAHMSTGAPGTGILILFTVLCAVAEIFEAIAGYLGVKKRAGSALAGFIAMIGGLAGAFIGSGIFPVLGTIAGILIGSFAGAFFTEWVRLRHHSPALHIAWGTVWAKLFVLFFKTALTLAMSIYLLWTLAPGS